VWVRESVEAGELVAIFAKEGVSRVLVCGKELDEVRGMLVAKDLLPFVGRSLSGVRWQTFVRPAYIVPDTKPVRQLLKELRQQGIHFAVVLNEHGSVDGIVTLEDLVEEIVGDIFDEFDTPAERGQLSAVRDGLIVVDGKLPIETLRHDHGVDIPDGDYDTVAGFVLSQLGRVPSEGESLDCAGWSFTVSEVHKHRVARLSINKAAQSAEGESLEAVNSGSRGRR